MTRKEKPLAGAGRANQQGASINYPQNIPFSPLGQGEASQSVFRRAGHSPRTSKTFLFEYHARQAASTKLCIVRGFLILHGKKLGIALGEVRA